MTKKLQRDPQSEQKRPPQRVFSPAVMDNSNLSDLSEPEDGIADKGGEKDPVGG